jgi:hypothetical protein
MALAAKKKKQLRKQQQKQQQKAAMHASATAFSAPGQGPPKLKKEGARGANAGSGSDVSSDHGTSSESEDDDPAVAHGVGKHKMRETSSGTEYLVKWVGFGADRNTWEPASIFLIHPKLRECGVMKSRPRPRLVAATGTGVGGGGGGGCGGCGGGGGGAGAGAGGGSGGGGASSDDPDPDDMAVSMLQTLADGAGFGASV